HRTRRNRPERSHRARADDVRVDLRRAARIRGLPVVLVVDADVATVRVLEQALERLVAREPRIAVQLRREHLDARARHADAELDVGLCEHLDEPCRIRRARGARYAEEDAQGASTSAPSTRSETPRADGASRRRGPRTSA